ncbi:unnamed protein product [Paramecium primaurelia]|uniref:Uncharacterized protein n=1 Tax=Paramecium primaurelia TaxID=5886 RepID=A0A8S1Q5K6_PARPR|nr:unnamed protein product [Paramecium primaurelia]
MSQSKNTFLDEFDYFKIPGPGAYSSLQQIRSTPCYSYILNLTKDLEVNKNIKLYRNFKHHLQVPIIQIQTQFSMSMLLGQIIIHLKRFPTSSRQQTNYNFDVPGVGAYDLQKCIGKQKGYSFGRKLNREISKPQQKKPYSKVDVYFPWSNTYLYGKWFENDPQQQNNFEELGLTSREIPINYYYGDKRGLWVECIKDEQCEVLFKGEYNRGQRIGIWKYYWKKTFCYPIQLIFGGSYVNIDGKWRYQNEDFDDNDVLKQPQHFSLMNKKQVKSLTSDYLNAQNIIQDPPELQNQIEIWSFSISIWFKDFEFENEDLLRKCFEYDWSYSKISDIITNQDVVKDVGNLIWKNYKMIKETYKQYSSYSPYGDVWSIPNNVIADFAYETGLIDKTFKLSDLDIKFIATCAASFENKRNYKKPERALLRYQFMELLVRISIDKYLEKKLSNNIYESVQMLLDQCRPIMQKYDVQKWRNERYFNQQCDKCLNHYKPLLQNIYNKYSIKITKLGQKKFMSLDKFQQICCTADLLKHEQKEQNLAFNQSIMTQVNELESDKIFSMNFLEFMEAIARMAEKGSCIDDWRNPSQQIPLHIKLEKVLIYLAQTCASQIDQQKYGNQQNCIFNA